MAQRVGWGQNLGSRIGPIVTVLAYFPERIMPTRKPWIHTVAAVLIVGASQAGATESTASATDRYGMAADHMPFDREIRIGPDTKSIGVWRRETIRFRTADGGEFTWTFDTLRPLDVFALERIAPAHARVSSGTTVYVKGELPISGTF
jgi:hypothetical protein